MFPTLFYGYFLRPKTRCDGPLYWKLCFVDYMGMPIGILALALSGMIRAMADICGDMACGQQSEAGGSDGGETSTGGEQRRSSGDTEGEQRPSPVSPEMERSLKLMLAVLNLENHILLVVAVFGSPLLVLPWLTVQVVAVLVELLLLLSQLSSREFNTCLVQFWAAASAVYNFLQVFCFLCKKLSYC